MKLTYRDKVIFLAVIAVIVIIVGAILVVKPKLDDKALIQVQYEEKEKERKDMETRIATLKEKTEVLTKLVDEVREFEELYYTEHMLTYQADQLINPIAKENKMELRRMTIDNPVDGELYEYAYAEDIVVYPLLLSSDLNGELPQEIKNAADGVAAANPVPQKAYMVKLEMDAILESETAVEDIANFVEDIDAIEKTIMVKSFEKSSVPCKTIGPDGKEIDDPDHTRAVICVYIYCIAPMSEVKVD